MIPVAQNPPPTFNIFLLKTIRRHQSLQGLNSSLAQSAAELYLAKVFPEREKHAFFETFWYLPKTVFLTHNFGYRYARRSIQGSLDADFGLVYKKTLIQKNGSMG